MSDPANPETLEEAPDEEADDQTDEAMEQEDLDLEAPVADAVDQHRVVEIDEDEYR
ncbi:hypothetical protein ABIA33_001257 [Streptacidiphilus sp. MAP12-16]|uniref:hypothetical protein n=1 Tax=Streptacidiphilus sp. MAP12-16 TaxID=3156300 RepID=UPI0035134B92